MAVALAVTPWLGGFCGLEREKDLDFFFFYPRNSFVSGTGAKRDTTDAVSPDNIYRSSPTTTPCPVLAGPSVFGRVLGSVWMDG